MPRNKSEKPPYECTEVNPDFYRILRMYAQANLKQDLSARDVREGRPWGSRNDGVTDLFRNFGIGKKSSWYHWADSAKRNYIADYMDYLYATQ